MLSDVLLFSSLCFRFSVIIIIWFGIKNVWFLTGSVGVWLFVSVDLAVKVEATACF